MGPSIGSSRRELVRQRLAGRLRQLLASAAMAPGLVEAFAGLLSAPTPATAYVSDNCLKSRRLTRLALSLTAGSALVFFVIFPASALGGNLSPNCSVSASAIWVTGGGEFINGQETTSCTLTVAVGQIAVQTYLQVYNANGNWYTISGSENPPGTEVDVNTTPATAVWTTSSAGRTCFTRTYRTDGKGGKGSTSGSTFTYQYGPLFISGPNYSC
jgi:hypothetical protein